MERCKINAVLDLEYNTKFEISDMEDFQHPERRMFLYILYELHLEFKTQREHNLVYHISWASSKVEKGGEDEEIRSLHFTCQVFSATLWLDQTMYI